ncbi:MAG: hypothetical protein OJF49_002536 [Ktedonobacterales bacterium]|jgi:tetratricopeptide (TPR) repeat protein|nr:MAG: hypothetical protein OJF49_002536 [Ktedonobacterales bacterium]
MTTIQTETRPATRAPTGLAHWLARALLLLWWTFAVYFAFGAAQYLGAHAAPPLLSALPSFFDWLRQQSPLLQAACVALESLLLIFMGWLTLLAFRARQSQLAANAGIPAALDRIEDQGAATQTGVARIEGQNAAMRADIADIPAATAKAVRDTLPAPAPVVPQPTSITRRIFLSSTYIDLIEYRRVVHDSLESTEQYVVDMAQFAAGEAAATVSTDKLDSAEYVVLIVAWRYGSIPTIPPGETRSITHQEYEEAVRLKKPIFVFLADSATEENYSLFPVALRDHEHAAQLHAFRAHLANPDLHTPGYFTTPDNLAKQVVSAITSYLLRHLPQPSAPAVPSIIAARSGLPRAAGLLGRDDKLEKLATALTAASAPVGVFAIEGIAGVGKTALAAEAVARLAESHADDFPGGFAWISCEDLAGASGLAELWRRVAEELQLRQIAEVADPDTRRVALTDALAERPRTLIALDNVEPALPAAALLDALAVPGHVALLLTARDAIPDARLTPLVLSPLDDVPAAEMFARILAQNTEGARPTAEERPELDAIVEELGGLPLAIELTAAYAGVQGLSLPDIRAQHARDGINAAAFKSNPRKAIVSRFDRSWDVLTPAQQRLFAGLALISGPSFPRAAALALATLDIPGQPDQPDPSPPVPTTAADAEAAVAALVTLRLVEPLASATGPRLRLHPLLREYAAARLRQLPTPTADRLGDTLIAYWLAYARAHPGYDGMDALEAEAPGLMGALTWAHDHARHRDVLALAKTLGRAWDTRGRRDEELHIDTLALEAAQSLDDKAEVQYMEHSRAITLGRLGRLAEARAGYARALALAQQLGDPAAEQAEVHGLAVLDSKTGRLAEARAGYARALALAQQLGDPAAEQAEVHGLAVLDSKTGRLAEARAGFARALALAQQLGDPAAEQAEVHGLAVLDAQTGRLAEARAGYARALALAQQLGDPAAEQAEVHALAVLDAQTGRLAEARAGYARALALAQQLGDPAAERAEVHELAVLDAQTGRLAEARAGYARALALAQQLGDPAAERAEVHELAVLDSKTGRLAEARAGYARALALAQQLGDPAAERAEVHELAVLNSQEGRLSEARTMYERAIELARQLNDPAAESNELRNFGVFLARKQGEPERGSAMIEQSLSICERLSDIQGIGYCHRFLAVLDEDARNRSGAIAHYREALRRFVQVESPDAEDVRGALRRLGVAP